jgi:hypothetical protein
VPGEAAVSAETVDRRAGDRLGRNRGVGRLLPGPRTRTLAAGGAVLAQVWGLGLGVTSAYAAGGEPTTDLVSHADAPALVDQLTGAVPALARPAAPVGQVLQERIRAGGLPLPGQATTVPDAFAIAAVLLPAVPPQSRGEGAPRASRSGPAGAEGRPVTDGGTGTGTVIDTAAMNAADVDAWPGPVRPTDARYPADGPAAAVGGTDSADQHPAGDRPAGGGGLALTAATPLGTGGAGTAVLVPIAAGMLLTGAAMYKHRGLPRGH